MITVKWFQVLLRITNNSIKHQSFIYTPLNDSIVLCLSNQFSVSFVRSQFKRHIVLFDPEIGPYPGQSGPGSDGNEGVLHIPQISKPGASPSDCLISYPGHLLLGSYASAEMQSVYSRAPADWAEYCGDVVAGSMNMSTLKIFRNSVTTAETGRTKRRWLG